MDAEKKRLRDEVAELGCHCVHPVWTYPLPGCAPYPLQVWSGTVTSGSIGTAGYPTSGGGGGGGTYTNSLGN
jgi:hypothetical protein